ncbi:hypothetical protein GOV11_01265 [Candidatus Woesearchaeota archaeon]|nr:hypothetical protein [Candidatus Woesearchaeota archaeon]
MARVLVGIPTYRKERYALVPLLQGLQKQSFKAFDILVVDNSEDKEYVKLLERALSSSFPKKRTTILHIVPDERYSNILRSREAIRDYFLEHKEYTELFFLDSDVIIPTNAIAKLLAVKQEVVTGVYLNTMQLGENLELRPCIYRDIDGKTASPYRIRDVLKHKTLPVGAAGLGCTLVTRNIVEKVKFRRVKGTEDVPFYRDAIKHGAMPTAVCAVKCLHLHFPWGDPRNKPFNMAGYKLGA